MSDIAKKAEMLAALKPEVAKKAGGAFGNIIAGMRAEIINAGLNEPDATKLIIETMAKGDCSSGTMCTILT